MSVETIWHCIPPLPPTVMPDSSRQWPSMQGQQCCHVRCTTYNNNNKRDHRDSGQAGEVWQWLVWNASVISGRTMRIKPLGWSWVPAVGLVLTTLLHTGLPLTIIPHSFPQSHTEHMYHVYCTWQCYKMLYSFPCKISMVWENFRHYNIYISAVW